MRLILKSWGLSMKDSWEGEAGVISKHCLLLEALFIISAYCVFQPCVLPFYLYKSTTYSFSAQRWQC